MKYEMTDRSYDVVKDQRFNLLKKKILAIAYLNTAVACIGFVMLTFIAVKELEEGEKSTCIPDVEYLWPTWQRSERGVLLAAVAVIDAGQTLVSALLVVAVYKELGACATPWQLHSALWLPAQVLAALTAAPSQQRALLALIALALLAAALVFWLSVCGAIRRFQRILYIQESGLSRASAQTLEQNSFETSRT